MSSSTKLSAPKLEKNLTPKQQMLKDLAEMGILFKKRDNLNTLRELKTKYTEFKSKASAFKGYLLHYQLDGIPKMDVKEYIQKIGHLIAKQIDSKNTKGLKVQIILNIQMSRKKEVEVYQIRSGPMIILKDQNIDLQDLIKRLLDSMEKLVQEGSGWRF